MLRSLVGSEMCIRDRPDVVNLTPQMLPSFASRSVLLPLEGVVPKEIIEIYYPNVVSDACTYGLSLIHI